MGCSGECVASPAGLAAATESFDRRHVLALGNTGVVFELIGTAAAGLAGAHGRHRFPVLRQTGSWPEIERRARAVSRCGTCASSVYPRFLGGVRCRNVLY